ncbi:hypothetical protein CCDG5_1776 [[Clostridium] cellulosi]|uniref:Uncharacterized protein n=1 Tax=[Clostridium] cellulosi TaxID=29343 RepID=A0A078KUQ4_9FIRM|nr:hypothetical protein CCDG5_1776 [[Clostridium] cellulosi]
MSLHSGTALPNVKCDIPTTKATAFYSDFVKKTHVFTDLTTQLFIG